MSVVMSRLFRPGDVVMDNCRPFVIQVINEEYHRRCHYCFRECQQLLSCSNCGKVKYCSKKCQEDDWKDIHRYKECALLRHCTAHFGVNDAERLFTRLVCRVLFDPLYKLRAYSLWDGRLWTLDCLVSHEDQVHPNEAQKETFAMMISYLQRLFEVRVTSKQLWRLYCILRFNSTVVGHFHPVQAQIYAVGLFINGSALKHACQPSCYRWFSGREMQVRALREINTAEEQPTVCYIPQWDRNRDFRRRILFENYLFSCECRRCADHTDKDFDFDAYRSVVVHRREFDPEYWNQLIQLMRELMGEHYPAVTDAMFSRLITLDRNGPDRLSVNGSRSAKKRWLKAAKEFAKEFEITHGRQHPNYNRICIVYHFIDKLSQ